MSSLSFKGKVVLVTGASSVIGSEVARHFFKLGASLVLTDSDKSQLNKLNEECGGNCLVIAAELTKNEDVLSVFSHTIEKYKKLDVLVNYAKMQDNCDGDSLDYLDLTMNVNVRVVYHVTMLASPLLVKTKGNIVNVSGVNHDCTLTQALSHSVSRSTLEQLTKCIAAQLSCDGVRVNSVIPGQLNDETNAADEPKSHHKKNGSPKDVADAVVFLASDRAAFISGANLPVDGGRHLMFNDGDINGKQQKGAALAKCSDLPPVQKTGSPKQEASSEGSPNKSSSHPTAASEKNGQKDQPKPEIKEELKSKINNKHETPNNEKHSTKHVTK